LTNDSVGLTPQQMHDEFEELGAHTLAETPSEVEGILFRALAEAVRFFMALAEAPIPRIAIENPIGIMSSRWRKPDEIIQPWQFGHGETKATCLWLKNLPTLVATKVVAGREGRVWREAPSPERWKNRSRTLTGIAEAMADQWGGIL